MISVFDVETRLSLGASASDDGNEIRAMLEALKSLDLKGCIVTADALRRHPKMAAAIGAQGGYCALELTVQPLRVVAGLVPAIHAAAPQQTCEI
jgi:hypothetical protein